jgi:hypothetical protein
MYAGWEFWIELFVEEKRGEGIATVTADCNAAGCGVMAKSGCVRITPVGPVGPGCWQLRAQHKRAVTTDGAPAGARATTQQSVKPHSAWPECIGKPAIALPHRATVRIKAVSHFAIIIENYIEPLGGLSNALKLAGNAAK